MAMRQGELVPQIVTFEGVRGYVDDKQVAWLNAEDIANGLGFFKIEEKVSTTGGRKTYATVRWARVNSYLAEFDYPPVKAGDYIPEHIFYLLAMKASNEAAKKFQLQIATEILPSIRKHGVYMTAEAAEKIISNPDFIIGLANQVKEARAERDAALAQVAELKPKADYCELILQSAEALPVTVIAKDYGMNATDFNKLLHKLKIQYKVGKTWVLYQIYAGLGYMKSVTRNLSESLSVTHNYWTQKGRMFLYSMLKKANVLPLIEREAPMATII